MSGPSRQELAALLERAAAELGVPLSASQVGQFLTYLAELETWSARVSLTAIRRPRDIILKHFADSLSVVPHLEGCGSLLDVGSGAGLPGLAVKIARPAVRLISVESRRRKVSFQEHVCRTLGLAAVEVVWGYLEPGCGLLAGESVECAVSRALSLPDFLAAALPFVAPGGRLISLQGRKPAKVAVPAGLTLAGQVGLRLPVSGEERTLVIFEKQAPLS